MSINKYPCIEMQDELYANKIAQQHLLPVISKLVREVGPEEAAANLCGSAARILLDSVGPNVTVRYFQLLLQTIAEETSGECRGNA